MQYLEKKFKVKTTSKLLTSFLFKNTETTETVCWNTITVKREQLHMKCVNIKKPILSNFCVCYLCLGYLGFPCLNCF